MQQNAVAGDQPAAQPGGAGVHLRLFVTFTPLVFVFNKIPLCLLLCVLFHWPFCGRINEASCMSACMYIVSDTHKWQSPALLNKRSSKLETKLSVLSSRSMHSCVQSYMTCGTWSWSCSAFKCVTSFTLPHRRCTSAFLQEMSVSSHAENNSYIGDNVWVFFVHHKNEIRQNKQHSSAQDAKHLQMIWYYRHHNRYLLSDAISFCGFRVFRGIIVVSSSLNRNFLD